MMTPTTKTTNRVKRASLIAVAAVIGIVALGYTLVLTVEAQTNTSTTSTSSTGLPTGIQPFGWAGGPAGSREGWHEQSRGFRFAQPQVNIAVGQTFTVTSTNGRYFAVGTPSNNGTASGTLTLTVTGKLSSGYTLSLSSGSVTVAGTTYTIASGTAQMNRGASTISGQGATTPTGQFILRALARGTFVGSTGLVSLDLQSGSSEYLVLLSGNISS